MIEEPGSGSAEEAGGGQRCELSGDQPLRLSALSIGAAEKCRLRPDFPGGKGLEDIQAFGL